MRHTLADLEIAQRHVDEGERRIAEQRKRVKQLAAKDLPTDEAIVLLGVLRDALSDMCRHRDAIAKDVNARNPSN
jgi:nitrate/nitrite-specific signal transduction histidine kinase